MRQFTIGQTTREVPGGKQESQPNVANCTGKIRIIMVSHSAKQLKLENKCKTEFKLKTGRRCPKSRFSERLLLLQKDRQ